MPLRITDTLAIDDSELEERFVRASGPGGQNVNMVSTAVELRFDVAASSLPDEVKQRLAALEITALRRIIATRRARVSSPCCSTPRGGRKPAGRRGRARRRGKSGSRQRNGAVKSRRRGGAAPTTDTP